MRAIRHLALIVTAACGLTAASSAFAAPVGVGAGAIGPVDARFEKAQFFFGPGYGYGPRYYGPGYGPGYGYYGPRPAYGPRVVCRFRPTPYGPRRVCFRRY